MKQSIELIERKLDFLGRNTVLSLFIIGLIAFLIRLYYFPYDIPLTLDALNTFFLYATDISLLGHLPTNYAFANNGWPVFLSVFFSILHFNNYLDYMNLQRVLTILISVLTLIPVYFLCARLFGKPYSLLGAALFSFEPRIIQNSVLGLTDPLYFFLLSSVLVLILSQNSILRFTSFGITSFVSMVRAEGLFLFAAISFLFFMTQKKEVKVIAKYGLGVILFVLILTPMIYLRLETMGSDGLTINFVHYAHNTSVMSSQLGGKFGIILFVLDGLKQFFEYLGWVMIPLFIFFVPISVILILRKKFTNTRIIIIPLVILSLPPLYAYSQGIQDTRYLYVLYPFFCVLSVFTVKIFVDRYKNRNIMLILIIGGVLLSSATFLDVKKFDYDHQKEAFGIAREVVSIAKGVNTYYPEDGYIIPAELPAKWPVLKSSINFNTTMIPIDGLDSLIEYIRSSEKQGLTHLVLDGQKNRPPFLNDVFYHPEKYPYLVQVYDSTEHGFKYDVKIFKIDYNLFNSLIH